MTWITTTRCRCWLLLLLYRCLKRLSPHLRTPPSLRHQDTDFRCITDRLVFTLVASLRPLSVCKRKKCCRNFDLGPFAYSFPVILGARDMNIENSSPPQQTKWNLSINSDIHKLFNKYRSVVFSFLPSLCLITRQGLKTSPTSLLHAKDG